MATKIDKGNGKTGVQDNSAKAVHSSKNKIISFFYVDDIVFVYKKDQANKVKYIRELLQQKLIIKEVGKLKWFLGLHVIQNHSKRTI